MIAATGPLELIGVNERVDQNRYSQAVTTTVLSRDRGGRIKAVALYATEDGTGDVLRPTGKLLIINADPGHALNATTIGAGTIWPTLVAAIDVAVADWTPTDTGGAMAYFVLDIPYHSAAGTLALVWFHTLAQSFNDAAGDDEQLELNLWYEPETRQDA